MPSKRPHIIVVGAGIVGSSLAYHLARQQAQVTLIDKATHTGDSATQASFAWIVAGHDIPDFYSHLRQQAIEDWHRVEAELNGKLSIDWCGALTWQSNTADTERIARNIVNSGYPVRLIDRQQIQALEPNLIKVPEQAMFAEAEGAIDPILTTKLFIEAACEAGAHFQPGTGLLSFITTGARLTGVVTTAGIIAADRIVLTAGTHTSSLCRLLGISLPVDISPAILLSFSTTHRFINRIVSNPVMELRAASNTLTLAAEAYIDESTENNPQAIAHRTLREIKRHWQGTSLLELSSVQAGQRPMPQDGLPIIGKVPSVEGLYLMVMHSGVTLAALAARLAAAEILLEEDNSLLSPYRLARFS